MNCVSLFIFISLFAFTYGTYNPIPIGAVIISTTSQIIVMQPTEYGGTNELDTIFTVTIGMTIVNTIYDPIPRNLYILFTNTTNGTIYLCQLVSVEQLDSTIYQLPISFNISNLNRLNSFTSDIINRRALLTDDTGTITLFSMSGLMKTTIPTPTTITDPIRSVVYANSLNTVFIITDTTVSSCSNFDINNLQCCEGLARGNELRSITLDEISGDLYVYVLDERTGIYRVVLNSTGCPTALRPINTLGTYTNLQFVIDRGLYFASGSSQNVNDNSILVIANGTDTPRAILIGLTIIALHISPPNTVSTTPTQETCFHGITYNNYRVAVVLAALFGTIMGIFMCFNALFCIDFFMTKRIIRNLKEQIPHNLLEDRWNKLVEEKYAKIALEQQRKKDDPPPPKRQSSAAARKHSSAATTDSQPTREDRNHSEGRQVTNPLPIISAYLRRKSESYASRRRSDEYRNQRQQAREELSEIRSNSQRTPSTTVQIHIEPVPEENETRPAALRQISSRRELLKDDEDFL